MSNLFDTGHSSVNGMRASTALEKIAKNTSKKEELTAEQEKAKIELTKYLVNSFLLFTGIFYALLFIMMLILFL